MKKYFMKNKIYKQEPMPEWQKWLIFIAINIPSLFLFGFWMAVVQLLLFVGYLMYTDKNPNSWD